ncbi:polyprenyl synthetase family protein [Leptospira levettii]|uniref:Polyprenyl synthetase family protein n=1 Tax=Leptospira levettii TaxID=2023178 RepID=A0A5R2BH43_9LEPT|nr:polyprenyl synthetase family protein [Leptospira levettii]PKA28319.1 geranylgeranyl pyrophosphate synthase [Leptospira sp. mixed culture ATI2-C-A1]MCG6147876.1 polyprenyl synthetase family protein [Leptospira levettii]MCW7464837.1 polyprenyl synthetase family protein [Leptospira levettii]MCW7495091.1 polyprenyl synthetase family protein [Leptospira levettii]MCW7507930.1 polyprenyl synthetase family protein [Leptospira levettii]
MKSKVNIQSILSKFDKNIDNIIHEDIPILKKIKKQVITSGGKRIRPFAHYLFCQFLEVKDVSWLDVGSVAELIHAASLLHDDVVDNAPIRRGKPTIGANFGNKTAILAGDYLLACGISRLNSLGNPELMEIFSQVLRDLSVSELLQMEWEKNPKITLKIYDQIIYGKTASLFGVCTESAAILAHKTKSERKQYRQFGVRLGKLFQKKDDCLDYFEDSKTSGKEFLKDFKNGLFTYPVLLLRSKLNIIERSKLNRMFQKEFRDENDEKTILNLMNSKNIPNILHKELELEKNDLLLFLNQFPKTEERELFIEQLNRLT